MSSSTTRCQGLQSFKDPTVLRLRLAPPSSISPSPPDPEPKNADRGLSFLQYITADKPNYKDGQQAVYMPPPAAMKRSASSLSKQSLEMCTESLGSETGTDDHGGCSDDELALIFPAAAAAESNWTFGEDFKAENDTCISSSRTREQRRTRRSSKKSGLQFPPPLTTVGGSAGVQMRSRREDGRLVLTAVSVSSCRANFLAERSDGRLRLRLTTTADYPTGEGEEEEEEETEEKVEEEEEEEEEEEIEKVERRNRGGRCKEETGDGNRGLLNNWEPFWVAT